MAVRLHRLFSSGLGPNPVSQIAIAVAVSIGAAYSIIQLNDPVITLALFGAAGLTAIGLGRPALFVGLFLLTRPMVDKLSGKHVASLNAAGLLGLLLVVVLVIRVLTSERQFRPRATAPFAVVLLLSAFACVPAFLDYGSKVHTKPVAEFVRLAAMLAVYVLGAQLFAKPDKLVRLFTIVGLSGFVPAVWGCIEWTHAPNAAGLTIARIGGPFTGPNPFGLYLALTALVLISLPRKALPMWVRIGALAPMMVALVGTYSRAGWALFLIGFALIMWRRNPALVAAGALVVVALIGAIPSIHDRVLPPPNPKSQPIGGGVQTPESYKFRIDNWNALLGKWVEKPIWGYGLTTTVAVNPRQLNRTPGADPSGYDAHNTAVKLLVEGGLVLLIAWIALIATLVSRMRALAKPDWEFRAQARSLCFIWIGLIVIGLSTDDPLAATAMMYGLLALTGSVEGAYRLARRAPAAPGAPDRKTALANPGWPG